MVRRKYEKLLKFTESEYNCLYDEFFYYKSLLIEEVSLEDVVLERKKRKDVRTPETQEEDEVQYRMDVIWYNLQKMRSPAGNNIRFKLFSRVTVLVLIIPHLNAGIEN